MAKYKNIEEAIAALSPKSGFVELFKIADICDCSIQKVVAFCRKESNQEKYGFEYCKSRYMASGNGPFGRYGSNYSATYSEASVYFKGQ